MRRVPIAVLVALVAAFACNKHKQDPLPPMPPDPQPKPETEKVADPTPKPPEPPPKPTPIDASLPASKTTVKLVSPGKGKRVALKLTPKAGAKQSVELSIGVTQRAELGDKKQSETVPTVVFTGDAEVKDVDKDGGAAFVLTVTSTDMRGGSIPPDKVDAFKQALAGLKGLTMASTVAANGVAGDLKIHHDSLEPTSRQLLGVLQIALPTWPALPSEPVGVGAKWQAVTTTKAINDQIDVTQTTDYELVKHEGNTWTIRGTTKVTGADQKFDEATVSKINGTGTVEVALVDGALYPKLKSSLTTGFVATDPKQSMTIGIDRATEVTPK